MAALLVILLLGFASAGAAQTGARQVLLLNSFERGSTVENQFAGRLRAELGQQSSAPLNVFEVSLQPALETDPRGDAPVIDYLLAAFQSQRLDLVVTLGGPAAAFAQRHRERLFPAAPLLLAAVDQRSIQGAPSANETAVTVATDPGQIVDGILRLLPDTRTIFVVIGASRIETFWRDELKRLLQPFASRVTFVWSDSLPFAELLKRTAELPPDSAIFYTLLSVDAAGVHQAEERTLAELRAVANAPLFGLYDLQLGHGVVGGPLIAVADVVHDTAQIAVRLLAGEPADRIRGLAHTHGRPVYDWRELRRWGISDARLPAGASVMFAQPTLWDQYRGYIVGIAVLVLMQSTLIAGLVVQRARRRRTEVALRQSEQQYRGMAEQNLTLAGRLITAQEAERTRIARDLHDDVSQQLAGVSIALSGLKQRLGEHQVSREVQQPLAELQQQTLALARNVRLLSHDLHPTVLRHLGLVKGLTSFCGELERSHGVAIRFGSEGSFAPVSAEAALCVYRIGQEALRNVIAHAGATQVDVRLLLDGDTVELTVTDDGRGFDTAGGGARQGLGLISIAERAKIAGGVVEIVSGPRGTRVQARIPMGASTISDAGPAAKGQVA